MLFVQTIIIKKRNGAHAIGGEREKKGEERHEKLPKRTMKKNRKGKSGF